MLHASNSTLYYEQAKFTLDALADHKVFNMPIRLVGLFAPEGEEIEVRHTRYHAPRYSRTVVGADLRRAQLRRGRLPEGRCTVDFLT
jgi:hypothetical protein